MRLAHLRRNLGSLHFHRLLPNVPAPMYPPLLQPQGSCLPVAAVRRTWNNVGFFIKKNNVHLDHLNFYQGAGLLPITNSLGYYAICHTDSDRYESQFIR